MVIIIQQNLSSLNSSKERYRRSKRRNYKKEYQKPAKKSVKYNHVPTIKVRMNRKKGLGSKYYWSDCHNKEIDPLKPVNPRIPAITPPIMDIIVRLNKKRQPWKQKNTKFCSCKKSGKFESGAMIRWWKKNTRNM